MRLAERLRGRAASALQGRAAIALQGRAASVAAVLAAAVLVSAQLFVPPIVGLANNGDFGRMMEYAGVRYLPGTTPEQMYFRNIQREFELVRPVRSGTGYLSSEAAVALAGRLAGQALSRDGLFDLRALGAVHALVLLAAIALLTGAARNRPPPVRWLAAVLVVFFFTDVGYVAPLNSFYSQAGSLLFLLLTLGIAAEGIARGGLGGGWLAAYFFAALLFVGSKPQEALQAPLLALLGWRLAAADPSAGTRRAGAGRRRTAWAAGALCVFGIWYYGKTPQRAIKDVALFHTMFLEILPKSPDPGADLRALGLDPRLARYSGMNAYLPEAPIDDPAFRAAFYDRFHVRDVVLFYVERPARLFERVREGAQQAFMLRTPRLGNFEAPAPPRAMDHRFGRWSALRERLDRHGLLWLTALLGGNLVLAAATWRRSGVPGRLLSESIAVVCAMAAIEFGVAVFGDWLGDRARHLYVFHAMCDVLIVVDVAWAVDVSLRRSKSASPNPVTVAG